MKNEMSFAGSLALFLALAAAPAHAQPRLLTLSLETRDPVTSQVILKTETVDSAKVAVIIVDPWNYHWCMTACERVSAMVPRWNRALECARKLGMPVLWAPSDVVGMYSGYPQRERALAVPLGTVPIVREMPPAKFTAPVGACLCGPGISCVCNYGHDGINPGLVLAEDDFIVSSTEEVYALLKQRGITHVIYMGLHSNMCLFGKPGALKFMVQAGLTCMVARDLNDAFTSYNPATGYTPDMGTRQIDEDLQRAGVPMMNVVQEWRKAGVWNDQWVVETVRITPWGTTQRPYFFEHSVIVTLTAPWLTDVEIHYTLDGSEPGAASPLYEKPLSFSQSQNLRAAALRKGERVSLPTGACFVRLPPRPPKPGVYLDEMKEILDPFSLGSKSRAACFWQPKAGQSYEGQPLRVRGKVYAKGLGFRAPSSVRYQLKPEYARFVSLAGVADNMLDQDLGRNLAMHCSVVFRVFIDGQMAAESPVMRISQEPWRFDVPIPPGSRFIDLVCMDDGHHNVLNLGDWTDAGFVLSANAQKAQ